MLGRQLFFFLPACLLACFHYPGFLSDHRSSLWRCSGLFTPSHRLNPRRSPSQPPNPPLPCQGGNGGHQGIVSSAVSLRPDSNFSCTASRCPPLPHGRTARKAVGVQQGIGVESGGGNRVSVENGNAHIVDRRGFPCEERD